MTFKKWQKPPKKWQKMSEVEKKVEVKKEVPSEWQWPEDENKEETKVEITTVEPETPDMTDIENQIAKTEEAAEKISTEGLIWNVWGSIVSKPKGRITFEAQVAPVPMFKMPKEIREYLTNNGFTTDVWRKDKEWLEKHNVDMEMIEKLKKFLTEKL